MIPLSSPKQSKIADLADALHALRLSKVQHGVMIDLEFYQRAKLETCGRLRVGGVNPLHGALYTPMAPYTRTGGLIA